MKKLMMLLMAVAAVSTVRAEDKAIGYDQLPAKAKQLVTTYFSDAKVAGVTMDKEFMGTTYDIYFTDGRKVEFDRKGEWKEVDCVRTAVPAGIIPAKISDFLNNNHKDNFTVKIERDKNGYELKLNNGREVKFNSKYVFTGYDD